MDIKSLPELKRINTFIHEEMDFKRRIFMGVDRDSVFENIALLVRMYDSLIKKVISEAESETQERGVELKDYAEKEIEAADARALERYEQMYNKQLEALNEEFRRQTEHVLQSASVVESAAADSRRRAEEQYAERIAQAQKECDRMLAAAQEEAGRITAASHERARGLVEDARRAVAADSERARQEVDAQVAAVRDRAAHLERELDFCLEAVRSLRSLEEGFTREAEERNDVIRSEASKLVSVLNEALVELGDIESTTVGDTVLSSLPVDSASSVDDDPVEATSSMQPVSVPSVTPDQTATFSIEDLAKELSVLGKEGFAAGAKARFQLDAPSETHEAEDTSRGALELVKDVESSEQDDSFDFKFSVG